MVNSTAVVWGNDAERALMKTAALLRSSTAISVILQKR